MIMLDAWRMPSGVIKMKHLHQFSLSMELILMKLDALQSMRNNYINLQTKQSN